MSLKKISEAAVRVIRDLPTRPTGPTGRYTGAQLQAFFDKAAVQIREAFNDLVDELKSSSGAEDIGFSASAAVNADNVQAAIENVQAQAAGAALGDIPDASITNQQMQPGGLYVDIHEAFEVTVDGSTSYSTAIVNYARKYPALGIVVFSVRALAEVEAGDYEFMRFILPSSSTIIPGRDGTVCAVMEHSGSDFDWELRISSGVLDAVAKGGYDTEAEESKSGWIEITGFYAYH